MVFEMTGDEIKALRRELDLTARKLGEALGVDQATVLAWEREELFPTKRHAEAMRGLAEKAAAEKAATEEKDAAPAGGRRPPSWGALADPRVWRLLRKLLAYPELLTQVEELAEKYADPADG